MRQHINNYKLGKYLVVLIVLCAFACGGESGTDTDGSDSTTEPAGQPCTFSIQSIINGATLPTIETFWSCSDNYFCDYVFALAADGAGMMLTLNSFCSLGANSLNFFTYEESGCRRITLISNYGINEVSNINTSGAGTVLTFDFGDPEIGLLAYNSCGLYGFAPPPILPPDASGIYTKSSSDCADLFETNVEVIQFDNFTDDDRDTLDILGALEGGLFSLFGTIDIDGNISVIGAGSGVACSGTFESGIIALDCFDEEGGECSISYERI